MNIETTNRNGKTEILKFVGGKNRTTVAIFVGEGEKSSVKVTNVIPGANTTYTFTLRDGITLENYLEGVRQAIINHEGQNNNVDSIVISAPTGNILRKTTTVRCAAPAPETKAPTEIPSPTPTKVSTETPTPTKAASTSTPTATQSSYRDSLGNLYVNGWLSETAVPAPTPTDVPTVAPTVTRIPEPTATRAPVPTAASEKDPQACWIKNETGVPADLSSTTIDRPIESHQAVAMSGGPMIIPYIDADGFSQKLTFPGDAKKVTLVFFLGGPQGRIAHVEGVVAPHNWVGTCNVPNEITARQQFLQNVIDSKVQQARTQLSSAAGETNGVDLVVIGGDGKLLINTSY